MASTMSKKELIAAYKVTHGTFNKWIRKIEGIEQTGKTKRVFTPKEVELIYYHLGTPDGVGE